jgi:hypothetical protein
MYQLALIQLADEDLEAMCRRQDYPYDEGDIDHITQQLVAAGLVCGRHPGTDIAPGTAACQVCLVEAGQLRLPEPPSQPEWVRRARASELPAKAYAP